jgi:hypothetical protein
MNKILTDSKAFQGIKFLAVSEWGLVVGNSVFSKWVNVTVFWSIVKYGNIAF